MQKQESCVDADTVTVIDGVFAVKDADGSVALVEFGELGGNDDASGLRAIVDRVEGIISDEDVEAFTVAWSRTSRRRSWRSSTPG